MSTRDLSDFNTSELPYFQEDVRVGMVVAEWNKEITTALLDGAVSLLMKQGIKKENIIIEYVPGSFELIHGAKLLAENIDLDGIIVIGAIIKGETPHFDFISQGVTYGIAKLNVELNLPFIFSVLTTNNETQAKDRAGGMYGNKGIEGAATLLRMIELSRRYKKI